MVDFVNRGVLTPEGQAVIKNLRDVVEAAKTSGTDMNTLPGVYKHFYVNVVALQQMNEAEWLRDYDYGAQGVYAGLAEQQRSVQTQESTNAIAEELKKLREEVAQMKAENATRANTGKSDPKRSKKATEAAAAATATADEETDATDE